MICVYVFTVHFHSSPLQCIYIVAFDRVGAYNASMKVQWHSQIKAYPLHSVVIICRNYDLKWFQPPAKYLSFISRYKDLSQGSPIIASIFFTGLMHTSINRYAVSTIYLSSIPTDYIAACIHTCICMYKVPQATLNGFSLGHFFQFLIL
jgi:hypothetical protein